MITFNNQLMLEHMVIEPGFLNHLVGKKIKFTVYEDYLATTQYQEIPTAPKKILPLNATKTTSFETILEHVHYDHVLQIFTINNKHKTRSFNVDE